VAHEAQFRKACHLLNTWRPRQHRIESGPRTGLNVKRFKINAAVGGIVVAYRIEANLVYTIGAGAVAVTFFS
jgi:hypothetical protein